MLFYIGICFLPEFTERHILMDALAEEEKHADIDANL